MIKTLKYFLPLVVGICIGYYVFDTVQKNAEPKEDASFIYEEIKEVSKLVTLESRLAEVYTLDESKKLFELIPIEKKALVIAKGKVQVSYNLEQIKVAVNEEEKTITISNVPDAEYIVEPDLKYYDLKYNLMPFTEKELTQVSNRAIQLLKEEAKQSNLEALAKQNLEVQLEKLTLVSKQKGWRLVIE